MTKLEEYYRDIIEENKRWAELKTKQNEEKRDVESERKTQ